MKVTFNECRENDSKKNKVHVIVFFILLIISFILVLKLSTNLISLHNFKIEEKYKVDSIDEENTIHDNNKIPEINTNNKLFENEVIVIALFIIFAVLILVIVIISIIKYRDINYYLNSINNKDNLLNSIEHEKCAYLLYDSHFNRFDFVSNNACKIFGVDRSYIYNNSSFLQKYIQKFEESVFDDFCDLEEQGSNYFSYINPYNNEKKYLLIKTVFIKKYKKNEKLLYCVYDDTNYISKQIVLNSIILNERKNFSSKKEFIYKTTHELRTPISGILGLVDLASNNIDNKNLINKYLRKLRNSSTYLLTLVNNLLDKSKLENGKMKLENNNFDLSKVINNVLDIVQIKILEKKQNLHVDITNLINENIIGDNLKLAQILTNLLTNANKYTQVGGDIYITISEDQVSRYNSIFSIEIKDTGIGMSDEFLSKLFTPFEQEKQNICNEKGTGLGLSIVNELVKLMGGTIDVKSILHHGTSILVKIPFDINSDNVSTYFKDFNYRALFIGQPDKFNIIKNNFDRLFIKIENVNDYDEAFSLLTKGDYNYCFIDTDFITIKDQYKIEKLNKGFPFIPLIAAINIASPENEKYLNLCNIKYYINQPILLNSLYNLILEIKEDNKNQTNIYDEIDFHDINILVVDDDAINREIISEFLRIKNANINFTESGEEAIEMFINSTEYHFDAVIIDYRLPGINGLKVSEIIRDSKRLDAKEVTIILMSANKIEELGNNVNKSIFNDFITKPININKLYTIINSNVIKK